jgi:hypothetical protein
MGVLTSGEAQTCRIAPMAHPTFRCCTRVASASIKNTLLWTGRGRAGLKLALMRLPSIVGHLLLPVVKGGQAAATNHGHNHLHWPKFRILIDTVTHGSAESESSSTKIPSPSVGAGALFPFKCAGRLGGWRECGEERFQRVGIGLFFSIGQKEKQKVGAVGPVRRSTLLTHSIPPGTRCISCATFAIGAVAGC